MKTISLILVTFLMSSTFNFNDSEKMELAPEIAMENPAGEVIKLSNVNGDYVLVDFWASWFKPCKKSRPDLKAVYDKYKSNENFEVYSISLDKDKVVWKQAIQDLDLDWANHVSTLNGFKSKVVEDYDIKGIPNNVLINGKGEIIERNIKFDELDSFLARNL